MSPKIVECKSGTLSVVIPVYNEERYIREVIESVVGQDIPGVGKLEIIVVDDCSADRTLEIVTEITNELPSVVKVFRHSQNGGKGMALQTGISKTSGDWIIIQDADLEYSPNDYEKLLRPLQAGKADVVYGSRFLGSEEKRVLFFWHMIGNRILTFLSNMFTNLNLTDMETGLKAFRGDLLRGLAFKEKRFGFEPEITARIARLGCRIYEIGIEYHGRTYVQGKKITWKDGVSALRCIIKYSLFN